jgi:hypothetical protein
MKTFLFAVVALLLITALPSCYTTRYVRTTDIEQRARTEPQLQYQEQYRQPSAGALIGQAVLAGAVHGLIRGLVSYERHYYTRGRYRYQIYYRPNSLRGYDYYYYDNEYTYPLYQWGDGGFYDRPYGYQGYNSPQYPYYQDYRPAPTPRQSERAIFSGF